MKGGDRRARRPGAVVLALLFGTTAAALALTLYYHLGISGLAVTFLLGLPALYMGWVALQDARQPPDRSLGQIADGLAGRLRSQWEREAEVRGLNDPYPLPVAWTAADGSLAGNLDALKTQAVSSAGRSESAQEDDWAKRPEDLAGEGGKLVEVLARVPTGRLVVLGEPGAGKTMLMVRLVLDLLARRTDGGRVPVLASLASWNPAEQDLHGWLGATLITSYPDLALPAPPGSAGDNRFEALLEDRLILPVLDGLDEIPESARPVAIARINKELRPREQFVVTCRTEQYRSTVSPQDDGQGAVLRAAVVQLSTLEFDEVASYLREDASPAAKDRWDFLNTLSPESPVRQALATPLMAGLARVVYNPRPGEEARTLRDPEEELCRRAPADREAVESLLFDAFISAAYRPPTGGRWTKHAGTWLTFLARHLECTIDSPDLAWWELKKALKKTRLNKAPARGVRISAWGLVFGFMLGLVIALVTELPTWLLETRHVVRPRGGHAYVLTLWLATGLAVALLLGIAAVPSDLAQVTSPRVVLARDRQVALLFVLRAGLVGIAVSGLALGLVASGFPPVAGLGIGIGFWLALGLLMSMIQAEWPSYMLTRGWLALRRQLPWSLMSFLADAHQRGVLRQAGAVYQFRHINLQHLLAKRRTIERGRYQR
jgi:hypothetical protein